jgi:hypothetical protein
MSCHRLARIVFAPMLLGVPWSGAAAQESTPVRAAGACFEIIVPQRDMPPARPLLFDRCTGATWLLVGRYTAAGGRARRLVYRWVPVEADQPRVAERGKQASPAPAETAPPARPLGAGERCFEFTGRRFCE